MKNKIFKFLIIQLFFVLIYGCNQDTLVENRTNVQDLRGEECGVPVSIYVFFRENHIPEQNACVQIFDPNNQLLGETITDVNGHANALIDCYGPIGYYTVVASVFISETCGGTLLRYGWEFFYYDGDPDQFISVTVITNNVLFNDDD